MSMYAGRPSSWRRHRVMDSGRMLERRVSNGLLGSRRPSDPDSRVEDPGGGPDAITRIVRPRAPGPARWLALESPRWHEGRLWFAHWGTGEIVAVDIDGGSEVVAPRPTSLRCPG